MGQAMIGNLSFRLDPESIKWSYTLKTKVRHTVGGKVIQVFGVQPGDLVVSGAFGRGGFGAQKNFAQNMAYLAQQQADNLDPIPFVFPQRGWRFQVYIKGLATPDGSKSVKIDSEIYNPKFVITLNVVRENVNLTKVATDRFISRLSEGIGWLPNEFNGPVEYEALVQELVGKSGRPTPTAPPRGPSEDAPGSQQTPPRGPTEDAPR